MRFVGLERSGLLWCCCGPPEDFLMDSVLVVENLDGFHGLCRDFLGHITHSAITSNLILVHEIVLEVMVSPGSCR